jgi:hypothetical protein
MDLYKLTYYEAVMNITSNGYQARACTILSGRFPGQENLRNRRIVVGKGKVIMPENEVMV